MLTAKQEEFAKAIVSGMNQADAYRTAYNTEKMSDKTIWESASKLMKNDKVTARIEELRKELAKDTIMTVQERLEWLTGLIQDDVTNINAKLTASDQMNKIQGAYVTRVEADVKMKKLEDLL